MEKSKSTTKKKSNILIKIAYGIVLTACGGSGTYLISQPKKSQPTPTDSEYVEQKVLDLELINRDQKIDNLSEDLRELKLEFKEFHNEVRSDMNDLKDRSNETLRLLVEIKNK